jgi:hypothetical protein
MKRITRIIKREIVCGIDGISIRDIEGYLDSFHPECGNPISLFEAVRLLSALGAKVIYQ